ncbi:MAG: PaaI family thioesterase [Verrucomicrobia bacterium]|nr:PaaI family thioesterase [Verrucomicrobiota bacterium]
MIRLPHTRGCFVCGLHNPSGLRLDFETDGVQVVTRFQLQPSHCGFQNVVHGGILATILDEVMVWACGVRTRRLAYCAEMSVRYLQPVPPQVALQARGELTEDKRGRLFLAQGDIRNEAGTILATSTGKYMPITPAAQAKMLEDFVEAFDARVQPLTDSA